jgi:monofunctional biosynthetic peptidoglycan transglycosylase
MIRWLVRILVVLLLLVVLLPPAVVLAYRYVAPPVTPLMLWRSWQGAPIRQVWRPLAGLSPRLMNAVVAAEDTRFCLHHGFDWDAIARDMEQNERGGRLRGASTISQQTAKNLLLWPDRSWLRKGAEAYVTVLLEALWPKSRIIEVYLNIIEWGPGIYGAEAASEAYFRADNLALTPARAALLAAVLPNPLRWSPARPTAYVERYAGTISTRVGELAAMQRPPCTGLAALPRRAAAGG